MFKWNAFPLFLLFVIYVVVEEVSTWGTVNVGTVLFDRRDIDRICWTSEGVLLLKSRRLMQRMIPNDLSKVDDRPQIDHFIDYVHGTVNDVKKFAQGSTQKAMVLALGDVIGGYMRSHLIQSAKKKYYDGDISYEEIERLYELYNDLKFILKTDGEGWMEPYKVIENINELHSLNIPVGMRSDTCAAFEVKKHSRKSSDINIYVPYLDNDLSPQFVSMPFQGERSFDLQDPSSDGILEKYYIAAMQCLISNTNEEALMNFNDELESWLWESVVPLLTDEEWYPAFRGVNRILATLKRVRNINPGSPWNDQNDSLHPVKLTKDFRQETPVNFSLDAVNMQSSFHYPVLVEKINQAQYIPVPNTYLSKELQDRESVEQSTSISSLQRSTSVKEAQFHFNSTNSDVSPYPNTSYNPLLPTYTPAVMVSSVAMPQHSPGDQKGIRTKPNSAKSKGSGKVDKFTRTSIPLPAPPKLPVPLPETPDVTEQTIPPPGPPTKLDAAKPTNIAKPLSPIKKALAFLRVPLPGEEKNKINLNQKVKPTALPSHSHSFHRKTDNFLSTLPTNHSLNPKTSRISETIPNSENFFVSLPPLEHVLDGSSRLNSSISNSENRNSNKFPFFLWASNKKIPRVPPSSAILPVLTYPSYSSLPTKYSNFRSIFEPYENTTVCMDHLKNSLNDENNSSSFTSSNSPDVSLPKVLTTPLPAFLENAYIDTTTTPLEVNSARNSNIKSSLLRSNELNSAADGFTSTKISRNGKNVLSSSSERVVTNFSLEKTPPISVYATKGYTTTSRIVHTPNNRVHPLPNFLSVNLGEMESFPEGVFATDEEGNSMTVLLSPSSPFPSVIHHKSASLNLDEKYIKGNQLSNKMILTGNEKGPEKVLKFDAREVSYRLGERQKSNKDFLGDNPLKTHSKKYNHFKKSIKHAEIEGIDNEKKLNHNSKISGERSKGHNIQNLRNVQQVMNNDIQGKAIQGKVTKHSSNIAMDDNLENLERSEIMAVRHRKGNKNSKYSTQNHTSSLKGNVLKLNDQKIASMYYSNPLANKKLNSAEDNSFGKDELDEEYYSDFEDDDTDDENEDEDEYYNNNKEQRKKTKGLCTHDPRNERNSLESNEFTVKSVYEKNPKRNNFGSFLKEHFLIHFVCYLIISPDLAILNVIITASMWIILLIYPCCFKKPSICKRMRDRFSKSKDEDTKKCSLILEEPSCTCLDCHIIPKEPSCTRLDCHIIPKEPSCTCLDCHLISEEPSCSCLECHIISEEPSCSCLECHEEDLASTCGKKKCHVDMKTRRCVVLGDTAEEMEIGVSCNEEEKCYEKARIRMKKVSHEDEQDACVAEQVANALEVIRVASFVCKPHSCPELSIRHPAYFDPLAIIPEDVFRGDQRPPTSVGTASSPSDLKPRILSFSAQVPSPIPQPSCLQAFHSSLHPMSSQWQSSRVVQRPQRFKPERHMRLQSSFSGSTFSESSIYSSDQENHHKSKTSVCQECGAVISSAEILDPRIHKCRIPSEHE